MNCVDRWNVTEKIYNYVVKSNEFINKNNKTILQEEKLAGLGKIINEEDLSYGFKESDIVEVEVFNPILDIEVGNILGKISVKDTGKEKNKFPLISNINIDKEELEKIILGEK